MMRTLKMIGLGAGIWSLSLLWPVVNQYLTPATTTLTVIGLGVLYLAYHILDQNQSTGKPAHPKPQPSRPLVSSITRPTKPLRST
jgi:hypothetical protein